MALQCSRKCELVGPAIRKTEQSGRENQIVDELNQFLYRAKIFFESVICKVRKLGIHADSELKCLVVHITLYVWYMYVRNSWFAGC